MAAKDVTNQRIAFFSPYLVDHLGGGEKHLLDVARVCSSLGAHVELCVPAELSDEAIAELRTRLERSFGSIAERCVFTRSPLFSKGFSLEKLRWTKQFDFLYYVTDGSVFYSMAKHSILHVQIPFSNHLSGLVDRLKLSSWKTIQTNSAFTKAHIEKNWGCSVNQVLHPVVEERFFQQAEKKQRVILGVGRFFKQMHSKRQDVLIDGFKRLQEKCVESADWQLVLIGSVEDEEYFTQLQRQAADLNVTFLRDVPSDELQRWYSKATLFWHATGFEQDENGNPERVEHFGISTIEAMASGAVPLAVGKGGQKEILSGELADLQWQSIDELVTKTSILMRSKEYLEKFRNLSQARARDFDSSVFEKGVRKMFGWQEAA